MAALDPQDLISFHAAVFVALAAAEHPLSACTISGCAIIHTALACNYSASLALDGHEQELFDAQDTYASLRVPGFAFVGADRISFLRCPSDRLSWRLQLRYVRVAGCHH